MAAFGWRGRCRAMIRCPGGLGERFGYIDCALLAVILVSLAYLLLAA